MPNGFDEGRAAADEVLRRYDPLIPNQEITVVGVRFDNDVSASSFYDIEWSAQSQDYALLSLFETLKPHNVIVIVKETSYRQYDRWRRSTNKPGSVETKGEFLAFVAGMFTPPETVTLRPPYPLGIRIRRRLSDSELSVETMDLLAPSLI